MKKMKRFLALALTMTMVLALAACGQKEETPAEEGTPEGVTEITWWAFPTFGVDLSLIHI